MASSKPTVARSSRPAPGRKRWYDVAGAWLGIGTSPGALLLGAVIAARHDGPIPVLSLLLSAVLMFLIVWFQGQLGLDPPVGAGGKLTEITPSFFNLAMQRVLGAVIAIGMLGWFGFNVGLGAAALSALLSVPQWLSVLVISLPVLLLSLLGLKSWNRLAAVTTVSVLILTVMILLRLAAPVSPVTLAVGQPLDVVMDVAVFVGYVSVFSVRAPDFSAGLISRRQLLVDISLLLVPVLGISLAGVSLQQGTGSADLVGVLARPGGLALGNLLIFVSVIAPTFTTLYSGAPALRAALGVPERAGMIALSIVGTALAMARFDLWLGSWLSILAAMLPPLIVPLALESELRRQGQTARRIPLWSWAPASLLAVILTVFGQPLAPLAGLVLALLLAAAWYFTGRRELPVLDHADL